MMKKMLMVSLVVAVTVLSLMDSDSVGNLYRPLMRAFGLGGVTAGAMSNQGHVVAGFFLSLLAMAAFPTRKSASLSLLFLFFVAIEFFQGFTATRTMSLDDLFRSVLGIGGGVLFHIALGFGRAGENGKG
jgi:hypothetical protein